MDVSGRKGVCHNLKRIILEIKENTQVLSDQITVTAKYKTQHIY
jgi:hypothetical protein